MRAGQLRHKLEIQEPVEAPSASTGATVPMSWRFFADVWADVSPVSGSERFIAAQLVATASHTIRMRWLDGVTVAMRAVLGQGDSARVFNFTSVQSFRERNRELVIAATEEVPARA